MSRNLIICDVIRPGGGPGGYVYNLRLGLNQLETNLEMEYWSLHDSENRIGIPPKALSKVKINRSLLSSIRRSDTVILHGYQHAIRALVARFMRKRLIYMPHSPSLMADEIWMTLGTTRKIPKIARWINSYVNELLLFVLTDELIFPSENASKCYAKLNLIMRLKNRSYIPSGVTGYSYQKRAAAHQIRVLFMGRYVQHKGYDLYIKSAEELSEKLTHVNFFSCGQGPDQTASKSVTDLGWVSTPETVIAEMDLIVIPNTVAYFDLLPLEVASIGRPMVMTKVGGNIDQINAFPDVIACNPSDLSDAIQIACAQAASDINWGVGNTAVFNQSFSHIAMADNWQKFLKSSSLRE